MTDLEAVGDRLMEWLLAEYVDRDPMVSAQVRDGLLVFEVEMEPLDGDAS